MRVGIVGYGHLGKYLAHFIQHEGSKYDLELDFVWNRSPAKLEDVEKRLILENLEEVKTRKVELIIEVAHPVVTKTYGVLFLSVADLMVGSPTALADAAVEKSLRDACITYKHGLHIPSGAFWGAHDIQKMANMCTLNALKVTMKKHPSAFRVSGAIKEKNDSALHSLKPVVLYAGSVRGLCPLAPNNVNTMAAAAMAASNLGFDNVIGCLVSDPSLLEWHIVEIEVQGKPSKDGSCFEVKTVRKNPANPGDVTGSATYISFCNSLLQARQKLGPGVHMC